MLILLFNSITRILAQETEIEKITVRKESNLVRALYDNNEFKLLAQDKYGNMKQHAIKSFELHFTPKKKKLMVTKSPTEYLTDEMLAALNDLKEARKLFFTNIVAEDEFGNRVNLPDVIEMYFPRCPQLNN
jgi:hypothetical protein